MSKPANSELENTRTLPAIEDVRQLPRSDERVGPPQYVVLETPGGWQLLLEYADHYLRWELRGAPGHGGPAWPGIDVAASSLETPGGSLHKPALERPGNEIGTFHNVRMRDGEVVAMGECLEDGAFELEFSGEIMHGRWRLSRSGSGRRQAESWTLLPLEPRAQP